MYLGIDFGTSGCRACIIDDSENIIFETHHSLPAPINSKNSYTQNPSIWWNGLLNLFQEVSNSFDTQSITDICINGTSATVVHCNQQGEPLSNALMYNDLSSIEYLKPIQRLAPSNHVTLSASSALSKMMLLQQHNDNENGLMLNQADWLSNMLCKQFGYSDYNNALKMGYDLINECWPNWITPLMSKISLPKVLAPGTTIGTLTSELSQQFGFSHNVNIKLGTTDSIAAFIATGTKDSSQAVTSLGSTLVLKQLSTTPIEDSRYGIYSHRLGHFWLAGGASNTGGKVLSQYFTAEHLNELSPHIDPMQNSNLNYYPLPNIGERFPINDPNKKPELSPRPKNDAEFLKGIFEGIANIEHLAYKKLAELGTSYPKKVLSCGGGAQNPQWLAIRQRLLNTEVVSAAHSQACYGSALLAKNGLKDFL